MSDPVRAALELASALAADAAQFGTHPAAARYMTKWSAETTAVCQAALATLDRERKEIEQLRIQLAGCLTAAEGATHHAAVRGDYGWSVAYQAVLDLRLRYDQEQEAAAEAREIMKQAVREIMEQVVWCDYYLAYVLETADYLALRRALGMEN